MRISKWLCGVCLTVLVVCGGGMVASATDTDIDTGVFLYEENGDGTITINGYNGTDETVIVPSEIEGIKVRSISDSVFCNCNTIKHLIIQEGIVNILDEKWAGAFESCENLETVFLPSTLEKIDNYAFEYCISLREITFSDGLIGIGEYAFNSCYNLKNIILPNSLTDLGKAAFCQCRSLSEIIIPGNVNVVKNLTFFGCINLQEIEIREGVKKIDGAPFPYCRKLNKIKLPNSINSVSNNAFICGYESSNPVFSKDLTIYANSNSYARTYANKNGIKFSCLTAHDWDKGVVTIEPTIKHKGEKTYTCTACGIKKSNVIPKAVVPKKGKTISGFNSKDEYKVTRSGTKNGTVEFTKTTDLTARVTVPDTVTVSGITYKVTSIAKDAFKDNKKITKVTIGKNVTKIGAGAFSGCKNLKTIHVISKKIKSVGKNAFKGIKAKARIKVPKSKLKSYKKKFAGKGQRAGVKITK